MVLLSTLEDALDAEDVTGHHDKDHVHHVDSHGPLANRLADPVHHGDAARRGEEAEGGGSGNHLRGVERQEGPQTSSSSWRHVLLQQDPADVVIVEDKAERKPNQEAKHEEDRPAKPSGERRKVGHAGLKPLAAANKSEGKVRQVVQGLAHCKGVVDPVQLGVGARRRYDQGHHEQRGDPPQDDGAEPPHDQRCQVPRALVERNGAPQHGQHDDAKSRSRR
mmetsp:Transcript_106781/g.284109  ORF Transcript_106781/g.284109 Transcript_106781/m.284109 type:complete len:221 (+) Transcript_106781:189-851(+)